MSRTKDKQQALEDIRLERYVKYGFIATCVFMVLVGTISLLLVLIFLLFIRINLLGYSTYLLLLICLGFIALGVAPVIPKARDYLIVASGSLLLCVSGVWFYLYLGAAAYEELVHSVEEHSSLAKAFESSAESSFTRLFSQGSCTTAGTCSDIRTFVLMTYWLRAAGNEVIVQCFGAKANELMSGFFTKINTHIKHVLRSGDTDKEEKKAKVGTTFCAVKGPMFDTLAFLYSKISWVVLDFLLLSALYTGLVGMKQILRKTPGQVSPLQPPRVARSAPV